MVIRLIFFGMVLFLSACGNMGKGSSKASSSTYSPSNRMAVTIGTSSGCTYVNAPCTSVTICVPNTSECQTISGILVDTGSFGLRIFGNLLSVNLPNVSGSLGECAYFGSGATWGSVSLADLKLGGEPTIQVPVQVINPAFGGQSVSNNPCDQSVFSAPYQAGFNGIMGIGLVQYDCGSYCATTTGNGAYFSCGSDTCSGTSASVGEQVSNPVFQFPSDNNGVLLTFPSTELSGAPSVSGTLFFGIGTQSDNDVSGLTPYEADSYLNVEVEFDGQNETSSFIDSGSNAWYFPNLPNLPVCSGSSWYCPSAVYSGSATIVGGSGNQGNFLFSVESEAITGSSGDQVIPSLGGEESSGTFDLGIPFFLGRSVALGYANQNSPLGFGPFWAF